MNFERGVAVGGRIERGVAVGGRIERGVAVCCVIVVEKEYWPTTGRCKYVNLFLNIFLSLILFTNCTPVQLFLQAIELSIYTIWFLRQ